MQIKNMQRQSKPTIGPVEFIDRVIKLDEKGEPFSLAPYQLTAAQIIRIFNRHWRQAFGKLLRKGKRRAKGL